VLFCRTRTESIKSMRDTTLRKFLAIPGPVPMFCALVPVVWCLTYGFTVLDVGSAIGRQSSTSGIVVGFAVLAALPLALLGFAVGRLAEWVASAHIPGQLAKIVRWLSPLVLVLVAVTASRVASAPILAAERDALPRVIVNSAQIVRGTVGLSL